MSLSADTVVAASNAWIWIPDNATTEATPEHLLVRFPEYFDHPLELLRFNPAAESVAALLLARGATADETLDVLAVDLRPGAPELLPPVKEVALRWATEVATHRDGTQVGVTVFGGTMP